MIVPDNALSLAGIFKQELMQPVWGAINARWNGKYRYLGYPSPSSGVLSEQAGLQKNEPSQEVDAAVGTEADEVKLSTSEAAADCPDELADEGRPPVPSDDKGVSGPTPLHLMDAPTEGTGKTLLVLRPV